MAGFSELSHENLMAGDAAWRSGGAVFLEEGGRGWPVRELMMSRSRV